MGCLYKIDFPNGKSYVGISSVNAEYRFRIHCQAKRKSKVSDAIKEYGITLSSVGTLVIADDWNYLCDLERKAIISYKTKFPHGYNMTDGGNGVCGLQISEATKEKLSLKLKGNKHTLGYVPTLETRAKISAAGKGRKHSEQTKLKIGAAHKGKTISDEHKARLSLLATGRKPSEETRKKLSARTGHKMSDSNKKKLLIANAGNKNFSGHKHTEETKEKMRKAWDIRKAKLKNTKEGAVVVADAGKAIAMDSKRFTTLTRQP